jgi:hypothetical protein
MENLDIFSPNYTQTGRAHLWHRLSTEAARLFTVIKINKITFFFFFGFDLKKKKSDRTPLEREKQPFLREWFRSTILRGGRTLISTTSLK